MYGIITPTPSKSTDSFMTYQMMRMSQYQQNKTNQLIQILTLANQIIINVICQMTILKIK